jgi:hypothetical protein
LKKKTREIHDDGRTIAQMNVDGMPWYVPQLDKSAASEGQPAAEPPEKLRGAARWAFTWGVLKAVLLVTAVFVLGYFLFLLFCTNIWFA